MSRINTLKELARCREASDQYQQRVSRVAGDERPAISKGWRNNPILQNSRQAVMGALALGAVIGGMQASPAMAEETATVRIDSAQTVMQVTNSVECVKDQRLHGISDERGNRNWTGRILGGAVGAGAAKAIGGNTVGQVAGGVLGAIVGDNMQEGQRNRRIATQDMEMGIAGNDCPDGMVPQTVPHRTPVGQKVTFFYDGADYTVDTQNMHVRPGDVVDVSIDSLPQPTRRSVAMSIR